MAANLIFGVFIQHVSGCCVCSHKNAAGISHVKRKTPHTSRQFCLFGVVLLVILQTQSRLLDEKL